MEELAGRGRHTAVKEEKKVRRREKGEFFGIQVLMWALDNNDDGISCFFPPSSGPLLLFCGDYIKWERWEGKLSVGFGEPFIFFPT